MKFLVSITFAIFVVSTTSAQRLIGEGSCIISEGKKYCGEREISQIFSLNDEAYFWYQKSVSSKNVADNLGVLTICGLATSVLLLNDLGDGDSPDHKKLLFGLGVGFVSCILGTVGLVKKGKSVTEFRKAIDVFNAEELQTISKENRFEFDFSQTNHGIGLVVSF